MRRNRETVGITLFELLVVIAVIILVAAITVPVLSNAKKGAYNTVAISNLKQCYLALQLYSEGSGDYPAGVSAFDALRHAPTCDKLDNWRPNCRVEHGDPLIGSYAYVRHIKAFSDNPEEWPSYLESNKDAALMIDIFASDNRPVPFDGDAPEPASCVPIQRCVAPNKVIVARSSGSIQMVVLALPYSGAEKDYPLFTWSSLVLRLNQ